MSWLLFFQLIGLMVVLTICAMFYRVMHTMGKVREYNAASGGQGFVHGQQAEAAERTARAQAYYEQVRSMEAAWHSYLENHFAVNGHTGESSPDSIRAMRAAFENMYNLETLR